jgi:hypothetical protein
VRRKRDAGTCLTGILRDPAKPGLQTGQQNAAVKKSGSVAALDTAACGAAAVREQFHAQVPRGGGCYAFSAEAKTHAPQGGETRDRIAAVAGLECGFTARPDSCASQYRLALSTRPVYQGRVYLARAMKICGKCHENRDTHCFYETARISARFGWSVSLRGRARRRSRILQE